jgi:NAD(P)-dependent dehydrogenase (short-subunit alcohol dehydrogenase family)
MQVRSLAGKTALITGAGSGIGRETALACARRGASLALCDLNADGLAETARLVRALGGERRVLAQPVDVASAEQMRAFANAVHRDVPAVDLLVNNAGVGLGGGMLDTSLEDWRWIVDINLMGVVHGCHFFVPRMVERGAGGHVVNVASAAGFLPSELLSAYTATKYAVLGLSESLHIELDRRGIGVSAICPGIINTGITRSARLRGVAAADGAREAMIAGYQRRNYGPERVAHNILRAVQRNRVVAPVAVEAWAAYYLKRIAPWAIHALARWQARSGLPGVP